MAMFEHEIRTHQGACPTHGSVTAEKRVPRIKFPFFVTGVVRGVAVLRGRVSVSVLRREGGVIQLSLDARTAPTAGNGLRSATTSPWSTGR